MHRLESLIALFSSLTLVFASSSEVQELRAENTELKRLMMSLEERVAVLDGIVYSLLPLQQLNNNTDLEARVEALEDTIIEVENDNIDQDDTLDFLLSETNLLQTQITSLQDESNLLQTQVLAIDSDVEVLEEMTSQHDVQLTFHDLRIQQLERANITDLGNQVEALEDMTLQLNDEVTSLNDRVDDLEASCNDFADTIFFANLETDNSDTADPVTFEQDIINTGLNYNPITGYYTTPYNGIYEFHVYMTASSSSATFSIEIRVDGTGVYIDSLSTDSYRSPTVLLELQAGQLVSVYREGGAQGDPASFRSYFWGRMISAL